MEKIQTNKTNENNTIGTIQNDNLAVENGTNITTNASSTDLPVISLPDTLTLKRGESTTLTAGSKLFNLSSTGVTWASTNPYIASVTAGGAYNAQGTIRGNKTGTVTISASGHLGASIIGDTCEVTVIPNEGDVRSITISPSVATLDVGEQLQLSATFVPTNATNKMLNWRSSDTDVVQFISGNGKLEAKGVGTAVITASATDGTGVTATCVISVGKCVTIERIGSDTVFHFSSNRTWKYLGCEIGIDCLQEDRDRHAHNRVQHFSTQELAYMYLFDPLGVEEYMKDYSDRGTPMGEALLLKDDLYEEVFGRRPRFFRKAGDTVFYFTNTGNTTAEERVQYHSDAELIFGSHNIVDGLALATFGTSIAIELLGEIPGVSQAMFTIDVMKALFFSGSITNALLLNSPGLATDYFDEYFENNPNNHPGETAGKMMKWLQHFSNYGQAFSNAFCPEYGDVQIYHKIQSQDILACFKTSTDSILTMEDIISSLNQE